MCFFFIFFLLLRSDANYLWARIGFISVNGDFRCDAHLLMDKKRSWHSLFYLYDTAIH